MTRDAATQSAVFAWLTDIRATANDPEHAHAMEDELHEAVLRAIATGEANDPAALAEAALQSVEIDFERWIA